MGAGDSWFATELQRTTLTHATVVCWDTNYTNDDLATPLPDGITRTVLSPTPGADLVLALDVVEHVADDHEFVGMLRSMANERGVVVVSVPAHQWLFGRHDVALGHHRRYSLSELRSLLSDAFDIVEYGTLFTSLLPPRALAVLLERRATAHDDVEPESHWTHGPVLTSLVTTALRVDMALGRLLARIGLRLPGLSVWAVCIPRGVTS